MCVCVCVCVCVSTQRSPGGRKIPNKGLICFFVFCDFELDARVQLEDFASQIHSHSFIYLFRGGFTECIAEFACVCVCVRTCVFVLTIPAGFLFFLFCFFGAPCEN